MLALHRHSVVPVATCTFRRTIILQGVAEIHAGAKAYQTRFHSLGDRQVEGPEILDMVPGTATCQREHTDSRSCTVCNNSTAAPQKEPSTQMTILAAQIQHSSLCIKELLQLLAC